jgi:uncharacterized protein
MIALRLVIDSNILVSAALQPQGLQRTVLVIANYFNFFKTKRIWVKPSRRLKVTSDPDDNIFLECGEAARADYLIAGNLRHFPRFWKQTKIVSSREFLDLVSPHLFSR